MFLFSAELKNQPSHSLQQRISPCCLRKLPNPASARLSAFASNASERVEYRFHSLERRNQRNACRRCKFLRLLYALCDPVASVCIGTGCYISFNTSSPQQGSSHHAEVLISIPFPFFARYEKISAKSSFEISIVIRLSSYGEYFAMKS